MEQGSPQLPTDGWDSSRWFWLAIGLLLVWLLWRLAPIVMPFAISAALAYLFDPLTDRLERVKIGRWKWNRTVAVIVVFSLGISLFVVMLLVVVPLLRTQVQELTARIPQILDWLGQSAWPWLQTTLGLQDYSLDTATITETLKDYWRETSQALFTVLGKISQSGQAVFGFLMNLILVPVVTFYLLRDWDKLINGIRLLLPRRHESLISRLAADIDDVLGAFIRGQLVVMLALGLIYAIGLWAIGLELGIIIGLIAGLLSIVPYLGTIVGVVAALVAAMFQFQDVFHLLLVAGVFVTGQMLEGMVLTPKLVGDQIGLHPVAVIFAVLAGGQLGGFLGILLALPVAAALNVLVRYFYTEYRNSEYYGQAPDSAGEIEEDEDALVLNDPEKAPEDDSSSGQDRAQPEGH